ncbi:MAG: DNA replication/repair protein RecF [bacterium]
MKLKKLKITNFRTYSDLDINFSDCYNIIYGNNGEGKTNLVESIYFLAITKSFRANKDDLMIKKNTDNLIVEGTVKTRFSTKYKILLNASKKEVFIDNSKCSSLSDYISNVNVILFHPDDVFLIKDSPNERRKLINIEISKIYNEYLVILNKYNKVLKMRNSYIKSYKNGNNFSKEYLDILTNNLIENGIKICNYRSEFIDEINKYLSDCYKKIFGYGNLEVKYISVFKNKNSADLIEFYNQNYEKEILNGKTNYGIHHDDIIFYLDGNKLKDWGSVGQHKNSILSFKLAEIEMLKKQKKESPILILDDLFSELDNEKIDNILKLINKDLQIFITTTDINKFKFEKIDDFKVFKIEKEKIMEENYGK